LHLLSLYDETKDEAHVFKAIGCLRYIALKSPSELRAHFLLIRLYRLIGEALASLWILASADETRTKRLGLILAGAPALLVSSLEHIQPTEIQLDNLLHVYTERGTDAVLGQTGSIWEMYADKAKLMYKRSASDVSVKVIVGC
jgi:N-terminal acetyltransferase B complex non-catalytic subunit